MSALIRSLAGRPLATYFTMAFGFSWAASFAITGGKPADDSRLVLLGAAMLIGPGFAAVVTTSLVSGRAGLRDLCAGLLRWNVGMRHYAFALLACPFVTVGVIWGMSWFSPEAQAPILTTGHPWRLTASALVAGLGVGLIEELGWTGVVVPRMLCRHGTVAVGLSLGALWGLWHFVLFWRADSFTGVFPLVLLLSQLFANLLALRVMLVWLYQHTHSLALPVLMHAGVVISLILIEPSLDGGTSLAFILLRGTAWAGLAALVVRSSRSRSELRSRSAPPSCGDPMPPSTAGATLPAEPPPVGRAVSP
jgi:membrane protease YdiL (CAAX protease family)